MIQSSALLSELSLQLDTAKSLVNQLSGSSKEGLGRNLGSASQDSAHRAAEKRANAAEAQVARLQRELEQARRVTSQSARDAQRLAYQDPLTGLGNAHLLLELTDKLLQKSSADREVLVIIIDIDRFSVLNQTLGHDLADDLLVRLGERLLEQWGETAALGRLSEDEFVLVVSDIPSSEATLRAHGVGEAVRRKMARPYPLQGQEIALTVSQGGTLGNHLATARRLFQQARTALTYAKTQGRDQFQIYSPELESHLRRDASLEFQLRYALESDELFLEYLPTVWLDPADKGRMEGRVIAVEACPRWRHRTEGVLGLEEFLAAAERSGQIVSLGDKVLEMVCADLQSWRQSGVDIYVHIRLSARQLLSANLLERVLQRVDQAGIARERLTFEFDDRLGNLDQDQVEQNLVLLQRAGFTLALGNFGDGALSLRHLRQVSFLKLSPRLAHDCPELCREALVIAAGLAKVAVGVGVDSRDAASFLLDHGCPAVQGKAFLGPVEPSEVPRLAQSTISCQRP